MILSQWLSVFGLASLSGWRCFRLLGDISEVLSVCVLISFSRAELLQRLRVRGGSRLKVKKLTIGFYL